MGIKNEEMGLLMYNLKQIESYILYLIKECGLSITLHPIEKENLISSSVLHRFNIHDNSYCACIKNANGGHQRCVLHQKKVFEKMVDTKDAFCGVCYAGVFEYVYPITNDRKIIGFISVSGYSCEQGSVRIPDLEKEYRYLGVELEKAYGTLRSDIPEKQKIDTLIIPLCNMIELAYLKCENVSNKKHPLDETVAYIRKNYATDLKSRDICERFNYSRSYLTHEFKSLTGKSFKEYLIDVRIENAKRLLGYSKLSVTEIAISVGFADASHFSNVFKIKVGKSPFAYRKQFFDV